MSPSLPKPVCDVVDAAVRLGQSVEAVVAVALVGSYARGTARPASDVDLIVLSDAPEMLLEHDDWFRVFDPHAVLVRTADFGAIQERRLRLSTGLVIEVGVGLTSWASVLPADSGTVRVVRDGMVALYDPDEILNRLSVAVPVE